MKTTHAWLVGVAIVVTSFAPRAASAKAAPVVDPSQFVRKVDNPFFPLVPGTTFHYEGEKDGVPASDDFQVTGEKKTILGVRCTVVHDQSYEGGILVEDTFDWFAQDREGNVWYFGEDSKELDANGNVVSTEGSWMAGVDGATPGFVMEADPQVGDRYRQEFAKGVAEDQAEVTGLDGTRCVVYGCFDHVLRTKEWSHLDPGVVETKEYAAGVGMIYGETIKGGDETTELVSITVAGD